MPFAISPNEVYPVAVAPRRALNITGDRAQLRAVADACLRAIETGHATAESGPAGFDVVVTRSEQPT